MPLFYFKCRTCNRVTKKILPSAEAAADLAINCPDCLGAMIRNHSPASSQTKEILDNGLMSKRVERFSDAEELYYERSHKQDDE